MPSTRFEIGCAHAAQQVNDSVLGNATNLKSGAPTPPSK
jgi:hypothetical protein